MSVQDTQKIVMPVRNDNSRLEQNLSKQVRQVKNRVFSSLFRDLPARRLVLSGEDTETGRSERLFVVNQLRRSLKEASLPSGISPSEILSDMLEDVIKFGPIAEFMVDDNVTEIMVNHAEQVFVEKQGKLVYTGIRFSSNSQLMTTIERILRPLGKSVNPHHPMVDSRLPDGSRVNVIIPPLAVAGPMLTIRKFVQDLIAADDLIRMNSMSRNMSKFLKQAVETKQNIVICGGTATGKTTLLNVLSSFIPEEERIITIEDAAELQLFQFHVGRLETRPSDMLGEGAVTIGDLFRNSLRMRPDRLIVGECRGREALDMLQAMNSGHVGSMTTAHANSARDVLSRLETMAMMAGTGLDVRAIRKQIASAIGLIVSVARYSDGTRKIQEICEITGMEGGAITRLDLFRYRQTGLAENGKVLGAFESAGAVPRFYEDLRARGLNPILDIF